MNEKNKNIEKFYEDYYSHEYISPVTKIMFKQKSDFLKSLAKDFSGKVLIVGCGSQDDMSIINDNCTGVGVDLSRKAIEKMKKRYPRFEYYVADALRLPFEDNCFDYVVCSEVIEHVEDSNKLISEVRRVLKDGGGFILTTPNWLSWYGVIRKILEKLSKKSFHASDQPIDDWSIPSKLKEKLIKQNFKIEKFFGFWYFPPFGVNKFQIPFFLAFPIVILFYPLELAFRTILPWFGHIIVIKSKI
jgi:SAM-dependent methyltransferase